MPMGAEQPGLRECQPGAGRESARSSRAGLAGAKVSKIGEDADSAKAWRWFDANLQAGRVPEQLEVWHEGRCGRCGRALTVPESIERGIGPECVGIISRLAA